MDALEELDRVSQEDARREERYKEERQEWMSENAREWGEHTTETSLLRRKLDSAMTLLGDSIAPTLLYLLYKPYIHPNHNPRPKFRNSPRPSQVVMKRLKKNARTPGRKKKLH